MQGDSSALFEAEIECQDSEAIGAHVVIYYSELFSARVGGPQDYSILDEFITPVISEVHNLSLVAIPTDEEIKQAVFGMDSSSAPGPDGFGGCFYHACWDIIAGDIYRQLFDISSPTL
ncbi:hypothetical protein ACS0TY_006627 [Phlomoides rotata]